MRLSLLMFIGFATLCVEAQQRQLRRFSPARARITVNVESESTKEKDELATEIAAPIPTRSRQRNALRPRPFSARFSGRSTNKGATHIKEQTAEIKPASPKPKPSARGQRRRPHFLRRKTTPKPTTTVAPIPEEDVLIEEEMKEVKLKDELLKGDNLTQHITHEEMPTMETVEMTKPKEPTINVIPPIIPKIKHRPLPIRRPRIGARGRRISAPKIENTQQSTAKPAESLLEEPLEMKDKTPEVVPPHTTSNRHRFAGRAGLIGRRPRHPRIKSPVTQKNDLPVEETPLQARGTAEPAGTIESLKKEDAPGIPIVKSRVVCLEKAQLSFDQMVEDVMTQANETKPEIIESIVNSLILDGDTFAELDISTNPPLAEAETKSSTLEIATGEPFFEDVTTQAPIYLPTEQPPIETTETKRTSDKKDNAVPLELSTDPPPSEASTSQVPPEIMTSPSQLESSTQHPVLLDNVSQLLEVTPPISSVEVNTTTYPSEVSTNKAPIMIATSTPSDISTKIVPLETTPKTASIEHTAKLFPLEILPINTPISNINGTIMEGTIKEALTKDIPFVSDAEYDYSVIVDYIDYPEYYTDIVEDAIRQEDEIPPQESLPRIVPKTRAGPSSSLPTMENNMSQRGLIGTVENTPEEQVREILSGLGSRRRGLSRM